jgi:indolepyruvate ferredoxin oxidoreductase alpha subunit
MTFQASTPNTLFSAKLGDKHIITGNDAYTRGLIEAGVQFFATYPGTPTSEIGDNWAIYTQNRPNLWFQLATNETVAFEAAVGASWSGVRSAVAFKHLGINLISDALHTVMYSGLDGTRKAGLVLICGGDPDCNSSTNAQDIRLFAFHAKIPIIEPSSVQECKSLIKLAFELSEYWNIPVLVYSPTNLHHSWGMVVMGEIPKLRDVENFHFIKDPNRFLNAIHWARRNQSKLNHLIQTIIEESPEKAPICNLYQHYQNLHPSLLISEMGEKTQITAEGKLGIISSGAMWGIIEELLILLQKDLPRLRCILTFPLNESAILNFIEQNQLQYLLIVEELEPFLELQIKNILVDHNLNLTVIGKNAIPREGALNLNILLEVLGGSIQYKASNIEFPEIKSIKPSLSQTISNIQKKLPVREPTFCPGCSHRNVFYAMKKAAESFKAEHQKTAIYGGDIGCYTMGMSAPYEVIDWLVCMGAGLGIANGVARVIDKKSQHVIAMIGDSTFFHSGIQPLIDLVRDNVDCTVVILDNYFCAMTGDQLSPSTPIPLSHSNSKSISIPTILAALGETTIIRMDGYSIKSMIKQFIDTFGLSGLKIVLVEAECALNKRHRLKNLPFQYNYFITEACVKCNICYEQLGCTAIENLNDQYQIDPSRCMEEHCGSCYELCPNRAIKRSIINPHLEKKNDGKKE